MTAICVWLGWESHVVRQRKAALEEIKLAGAFVLSVLDSRELTTAFVQANASTNWPAKDGAVTTAVCIWATAHSSEPGSIPFVREWLGDEAIASITLASRTSEEELVRIATLFPEAHVGRPPYSSPIDDPRSMTR